MRIPNAVHESRPWRIRQIVPDFTLEDVWALPVQGSADDFQTLIEMAASDGDDLVDALPWPARALWRIRDRLGGWFGLGRISVPVESDRDDAAGTLPIPDTNLTTLADRLPDELGATAADVRFASVPFTPLYRTDVEFAAEMSNRTVHSVMHLAWVDRGEGRYQGQMAVYVKPRGLLGTAYMALIKPFRYGIVYPALMRTLARMWARRVGREAKLRDVLASGVAAEGPRMPDGVLLAGVNAHEPSAITPPAAAATPARAPAPPPAPRAAHRTSASAPARRRRGGGGGLRRPRGGNPPAARCSGRRGRR